MLLLTLMYKLLCGRMFSLLWDTYLREELLGRVIFLFNFWDKHHFTFLLAIYEFSNSYSSLPTHVNCFLFFNCNNLIRYRICKYFLLFCGISFHSLGSESVYVEIRSGMFLKILFICWLRWVFIAARGLSLAVASRGSSLAAVWCEGFSVRGLLLLRSTGCRVQGLQQLQGAGSAAVACGP